MPLRKWWSCAVCKHHKWVDSDCKYIQCQECGSYFDISGRKISAGDVKPGCKCDVS